MVTWCNPDLTSADPVRVLGGGGGLSTWSGRGQGCASGPDRRLLVAVAGGALAGWVHLQRHSNPVIAHWGLISHLQTLPAVQGQGIGGALMTHARQVARQEMGLEQLHLAARGGMGLENFYARLGWREIGRWPGALRLAPGDDRDEVLMVLSPL